MFTGTLLQPDKHLLDIFADSDHEAEESIITLCALFKEEGTPIKYSPGELEERGSSLFEFITNLKLGHVKIFVLTK